MRLTATLFAGSLALPGLALAQQSDSPTSGSVGASPATTAGAPPTRSGFGPTLSLEAGDSVTEDLSQDDIDTGAVLTFPRFTEFFAPWFDGKRKLNERYGLKLQMSYQALYQEDDADVEEDRAAAGRGEIQGTWTVVGRDTKDSGFISFRLENRHTLGADIPPSQLGAQFGAVTSTGTGFSDFGTALTELAWRQSLRNKRLQFVGGKISASSWYNAYALSSPKRGFQNTALQSSVSKPVPGRGIGGGFAIRLGEQYGLVAGIHDANARTPDNPFDTIDESEFFQSVEFRWYPTTFDRGRWDQVRLQLWHQDERVESGIPSGQGFTFAASRLFGDKWLPFVLGGYSDGDASTFKKDLVAGIGVGFNTVHRAARDVLAFALSWGDPSAEAQQDQYTGELFYRFQLVQSLAITPSAQYIVDPAANPEKTEVWVVGLRVRLTF